MQALKALVIGMGVLIVVGTAVVVATIVHRLSAPRAGLVGDVVLGEPAGSRILSASPQGGTIAVVLSGGGQGDRVVVLDLASGKTLARVRLAP